MSELSPDARDLIAQARKQGSELLGPSPHQRAQLRDKLTPLWAAETQPPRAISGARWKKLGSLAIVASIGLLSWLYTQSDSGPGSATQLLAATADSASKVEAAKPVMDAYAATTEGDPCRQSPSCITAAAGRAPKSQTPCASASPAQPCITAAAGGEPKACAGVDCRGPAAADAPVKLMAAGRKPKRAEAETVQRDSERTPPSAAAQPKQQQASARAPRSSAAWGKQQPASDAAQAKLQLEPEPAQANLPARSDADLLAEIGLTGDEPAAPPASAQRHVPRVRAPEPNTRLLLLAAAERTPERAVQTDPDPAPPSIDGELELLGAAQTALQNQRPSRALSLLQEHAFRFPTGAMVEERMAMHALALCGLQRRQAAQTVLSNLEARGSQSQLLPRVRSQCGL